jgi:hypothetical protein
LTEKNLTFTSFFCYVQYMADQSTLELSPFIPVKPTEGSSGLEAILGENERPVGPGKSDLLKANLAEEDKRSVPFSEKPPLEAIKTSDSPLGKPEIPAYTPPSGTTPTK